MKRVTIASHEPRVRCYFTFPGAKPDRKYRLYVEKLMVPSMDSQVLTGELFTVRRRLRPNAEAPQDEYNKLINATFIAENVQTVSQLVWDVNLFLKEFVRRNVSAGLSDEEKDDEKDDGWAEPVPADLKTQIADWAGIPEGEIDTHLFAVLRTDGLFGFQFSPSAQQQFTIELTQRGQEVFGHPTQYIAVSGTSDFASYEVAPNIPALPLTFTANNAPIPTNTTPVRWYGTTNLFSHLKYRHELVLDTDLPLASKVVCNGNNSYRQRELASYEFPNTRALMSSTQNRRFISETTSNIHAFETSISTHNNYMLTGTDLQNMTFYLDERFHEKTADGYVEVRKPYRLSDGSYWTLQLALLPVK